MASGHGGQKRNRTYSAVRLTHIETGLSVIAEESRSQAENKIRAIKRLRMSLALHIRKQPTENEHAVIDELTAYLSEESPLQINTKNPRYPLVCAIVLDAMYAAEGKISDVSRLLHISTGRLNKFLSKDKDLLQSANAVRSYFNLKPLKSVQ